MLMLNVLTHFTYHALSDKMVTNHAVFML